MNNNDFQLILNVHHFLPCFGTRDADKWIWINYRCYKLSVFVSLLKKCF